MIKRYSSKLLEKLSGKDSFLNLKLNIFLKKKIPPNISVEKHQYEHTFLGNISTTDAYHK